VVLCYYVGNQEAISGVLFCLRLELELATNATSLPVVIFRLHRPVANYQFAITRHSRLRQCGTANVFPALGKEVWGAVYDVCDEDLNTLDGFEDGYRREILPVYALDNGQAPLNVLVYVAAVELDVPLPNAEYKRLILEGAKHWNLPVPYLSLLEEIQAAY
jgi:gamma-glutamylcyclotransferase (GGCT)/AIG2-like uncharacterized protein YtfP